MRRRGRACALQILYQLDLARELTGHAFTEPAVRGAMARYWHNFEQVGLEDERFAERLVLGIARQVDALDGALGAVSQNWRIDRMDKVDRNILRLAAFELLHCPDIPRAASINEAIELTKRFSGQESAAFINGVLDKLAVDKPNPSASGKTSVADRGADAADDDDYAPARPLDADFDADAEQPTAAAKADAGAPAPSRGDADGAS